jgi:hypothetical protein
MKKKRVTIEELKKLAYEHPWSTKEELLTLIDLVTTYNDVKKALNRFFKFSIGWIE